MLNWRLKNVGARDKVRLRPPKLAQHIILSLDATPKVKNVKYQIWLEMIFLRDIYKTKASSKLIQIECQRQGVLQWPFRSPQLELGRDEVPPYPMLKIALIADTKNNVCTVNLLSCWKKSNIRYVTEIYLIKSFDNVRGLISQHYPSHLV